MPKHPYIHSRRLRRPHGWAILILFALLAGAFLWYWRNGSPVVYAPNQPQASNLVPRPGSVLGVDSVQTFTPAQAAALARQNYGATTPAVTVGVTKISFHYRSELPGGAAVTIYGRAYLPDSAAQNLPVFAFAPGTTGIGDQCAASLEQPGKVNWGNYDSHLATYASQGFAAVTTDYEGMRDPSRIHHYMVGELEGRAVLDSVRALRQLPQAKGRLSTAAVFLGGYSQGGHAAFWADKIAAAYAPDVKPLGVVGFGPVMSVKQTLADITRAANINWFGPYVLFSYQDYYHTNYGPVLLPRFEQSLATDVPAHCIDTDIPFWGHVPASVYIPAFLQALGADQLGAAGYSALEADLDRNAVGADSTSSAKRVNSGDHDNVVLPSQQQAAATTLCTSSSGPVQLSIYPNTTHYDTMVHSLNDTLAWMRSLISGGVPVSTCPAATPVPAPTPLPPATPSPSPELMPTPSPAP